MAESFRDTPTLTLLRALHRSYRDVHCADSANLRQWGLQHSEFDVIATLGNTCGVRMGDIARRTLSSPANVTRIVKRLEQRGLVARARSATSDREVVARLTAEGESLFEETYAAQYHFMKGFFEERLTETERDNLTALLNKLQVAVPCEEGTD